MTTHRTAPNAVIALLVIGIASMVATCGPAAVRGDLADAVAEHDIQAARALLEGGVDPDSPRANGLTPLMRAAIRDDVTMVALLLDYGADIHAVDPEGLTAAHAAAQADAASALALIVDRGFDPSVQSRNGMAVVHHAAARGAVAVLDMLVERGVDPNEPSDVISQGHGAPRDVGSTPLGIATRAGELATMQRLIDLGADVDGRSRSDLTPLLIAVFTDQSPEAVSLLLDAGADPRAVATCTKGCGATAGSALDWAYELDREQLIPVLAALSDS